MKPKAHMLCLAAALFVAAALTVDLICRDSAE